MKRSTFALDALPLSALIVMVPIALYIDGPIAIACVSLIGAVSLAVAGIRTPPGEAAFLSTIIGLPAALAAIPALWMLFQVVPASILANPIWQSASDALGASIVGTISVDPGATMLSLAKYVAVIGIGFVTATFSVDRSRAGAVLVASTVAATVIALLTLTQGRSSFSFLGFDISYADSKAGVDCAALGLIFAAAAALRKLDKILEGKTQLHLSQLLRITPYLLAFCICAFTIASKATAEIHFAVACGGMTFFISTALRRLRTGPWVLAAITSVTLVLFGATVFIQTSKHGADITLAFSDAPSASLVNLATNILADSGWAGTGAGTYAALVPIYRDIQELSAGPNPPTATGAIAIEMGRPFLWAAVAASGILAIQLLRGAMSRGRDEFYSTAGASSIVMAIILAFGNSAVLGIPVSVLTTVVIGLGIAQSKGRAIKR